MGGGFNGGCEGEADSGEVGGSCGDGAVGTCGARGGACGGVRGGGSVGGACKAVGGGG